MPNDFINEFDAPAASAQVDTSPAAAPAPEPTNQGSADAAGDQSTPDLSRELLDSYDDIGRDAPAQTETLSPTPAIDETVADSQKTPEPPAEPEITPETAADVKDAPAAAPETKAAGDDWENLTADEEAEKDNLPKGRWDSFQKNTKLAKMAKSFLNPSVPADTWLENVEKKSPSRYREVEQAAFARRASQIGESVDPVQFLDDLFVATAGTDGQNAEKYGSLLTAAVETNTPFIIDALKAKGFTVSETGTEINPANPAGSATEFTLSDEELESLDESFHLAEYEAAYPEEAKTLREALISARQIAAERDAALESGKKTGTELENVRTEAEKAKTEQPKEDLQAAAALSQANEIFGQSYDRDVTTAISAKLDKDFGLSVTDEERAANPLLAFAKEAKKAIILNGYGDEPDFDNAMYKWGMEKPAFKQSAEAALKFASAGERANAENAIRDIGKYAETFMSERLKMPQLALIDELIGMIAERSAEADTSVQEIVPSGFNGNTAFQNQGSKTIVAEYDDIR